MITKTDFEQLPHLPVSASQASIAWKKFNKDKVALKEYDSIRKLLEFYLMSEFKNRKITLVKDRTPEQEGQAAFYANITSCPFPEGSESAVKWHNGRMRAAYEGR